MKKTLFTLFTAISFALLYCPAALALTEDEAAAAVGAQGKDAVMGLGAAKAAATTTNTKTAPSNTFAGGLSGMVSRHVQQSAASSISGQSGGIGASLGSAMYHNSLGKDGGFASKVIGSIATGQTGGSITGDSAVEAVSYTHLTLPTIRLV